MRWIPLETDRSRDYSKRAGSHQVLYPSPYDIPVAFSSCLDKAKGVLSIFFKYVTEESMYSFKIGNEITVHLGRNSHRLYQIDLALSLAARDTAQIEVREAIDELLSGRKKVIPSERYVLPRDVISDYEEDIFQSALCD